VAEVIAARKVSLSLEDARALVKRAIEFQAQKGRAPSLSSADPWEKRMAEGVVYLQRMVREGKNV
jgi:cytochrome c5